MADLSDNYPGIRSGSTLPLKNLQGAGAITFGDIWYVSSATTGNFIGSDTANNGKSPGAPYATLGQAITSATASQGDIIYLLPGHAETITGAAGVALSKAGLTIIGLGSGGLRPTFTFGTSAAASFDITAANNTIQNCIFTCNIDAQTAMMNINKADVGIYDCVFNTNSGTKGAVLGILTAATAARLTIKRCQFLGPLTNTGTTTTAQIQHEVGIDYVIADNYFMGKVTQNITNATAVLGGFIVNNLFVTGTGTKSINLHASSTAFMVNNRMTVASGTAPIVAAGGYPIGNAYSAAAGVTASTAATFGLGAGTLY